MLYYCVVILSIYVIYAFVRSYFDVLCYMNQRQHYIQLGMHVMTKHS